MNDCEKLTGLKQLTAARLLAERSRYAKCLSEENRLRRNLLELGKDRSSAVGFSDHDSPAFAAGAEVRWQRWIDQRRVVINTELSRTLAEKLQRSAALKRAFGKDQAVGRLLEVAQAARMVRRQRLDC